MKKMLVVLMSFVVLISFIVFFSFVSREERKSPVSNTNEAFPGKIAIVTNTSTQNPEEYLSASVVAEKYGTEKIVHYVFPDNFMNEHDKMVRIMEEIASDKDIKAIVINSAVYGTNFAVDKLLSSRSDMFIVYCDPAENPAEITARADLVLSPAELESGPAMVRQAIDMGAKAFVHYSFPRHMSTVMLATRRELIRETCGELGIEFIDATAPDPTGNAGMEGARKFILEDVPELIEKHGKDTAFFSTNCGMQPALIRAVVENGGIFPQPCCPSPFHGFLEALDIQVENEVANINYVISETSRILAERGMTGRLSTWPVSSAVMFAVVGAEYAIKWLNEEVPDEGIDKVILGDLCREYAKEVYGSEINVSITSPEENDIAYNNYFMPMLDYITY